jgi:hypothetical protein
VALGDRRGAYRVVVGTAVGKRPRCRWEGNIKMDFKKWIGEARIRLLWLSGYGQMAGCCECGNETSGLIKCGKYLD